MRVPGSAQERVLDDRVGTGVSVVGGDAHHGRAGAVVGGDGVVVALGAETHSSEYALRLVVAKFISKNLISKLASCLITSFIITNVALGWY